MGYFFNNSRFCLSYLFVLLSVSALFLGCGAKVKYADPVSDQPLSTNFSFSDLSFVAVRMIDSLLFSPVMNQISAKGKPVVIVDRLQNQTDQHIDTVSLTDTIRTQLLRSGKFSFTDKTTRTALNEELQYQNRSGYVSQESAAEIGQQEGAKYMLTGALVSYEERNKSQLRKAYKITLNLINIKTGVIEWADETQLGKDWKRGSFGP